MTSGGRLMPADARRFGAMPEPVGLVRLAAK
jgi:hypothetical protein